MHAIINQLANIFTLNFAASYICQGGAPKPFSQHCYSEFCSKLAIYVRGVPPPPLSTAMQYNTPDTDIGNQTKLVSSLTQPDPLPNTSLSHIERLNLVGVFKNQKNTVDVL